MNNVDSLDEFHDQVAAEIDRRKLKKLVDNGTITTEQLANAPVVFNRNLTGQDPRVEAIICKTNGCNQYFENMDQFEEHVAMDHIKP